MKRHLILSLVVATTVACGGDGDRRVEHQQFETVEEGSAGGVTAVIGGPGENLPPLTGTNADTTTAFAINTNTLPTEPPSGALEGTLPSTPPPIWQTPPSTTPPPMTSASRTPEPAPPAKATPPRPTTQPRPVVPPTPEPAPVTPPSTSTETAPPTEIPTPQDDAEAEEATPPETETDTTASEPPPPPPPA